jgi:surface protein
MKNIKNLQMAMALVLLLTGIAAPAMAVEHIAEAASVEGRRALMVDEDGDFAEGVHNALFRLGGTKLRFVAESTVTSDVEVYIDKRGTAAYAVRNGEWLEVHTLGKEFMLPKDASGLFDGIDYLKFTKLTAMDLNDFNTSKVRDMSYMFSGCSALQSLDLSGFNTSKVEDMSCMFWGCSFLGELDLSSFDTSKVKDMHGMFEDCLRLSSLDLSNFDTSNVTDMSCMFYMCRSLTSLDLSSFHTSKVTSMKLMFHFCDSLKYITLGKGFDTSHVVDMNGMFFSCDELVSLDLSRFDI